MLNLKVPKISRLAALLVFADAGVEARLTQAGLDVQQLSSINSSGADPIPEDEIVPRDMWININKQLAPAVTSNPKLRRSSYETTPSPVLDPWADRQPYYTAIGDTILKRLMNQPPTKYPPPTQEATEMALSTGCPQPLLPHKIRVRAPDLKCGRINATWNDPMKGMKTPNDTSILHWGISGCSEVMLRQKTYANINTSDETTVVGLLRQRLSLSGTSYDYIDCSENTRFSVEEQVFRQGVDEAEAGELGMMHTIHRPKLFMKYVVYNANGSTLAETNIFPIGNETFWWHKGREAYNEDPLLEPAHAAATAQRIGRWQPKSCGDFTREWSLEFEDSNGPPANTTNHDHWRLALTSAMTVLAWRDELRRQDGLVESSTTCNVESSVVFWVLVTLALVVTIIILAYLYTKCVKPATVFLVHFEEWFFSRKLVISSKWRTY